MKLTITLTQRGIDRLNQLVEETGTNRSLLLELGLDRLFEVVPKSERRERALEMLEDRRPRTRSGWRKLFWDMLADEMGKADPGRGRDRFEMVPRTYCGFQVIFDASKEFMGEDGREVLVFTDTAPPFTADTIRLNQSWIYRVGDPVSEAAREVAAWLRENEPKLQRAPEP